MGIENGKLKVENGIIAQGLFGQKHFPFSIFHFQLLLNLRL